MSGVLRLLLAGGVVLALAAGTAGAQTWVTKVSGGGIGNPLTVNPLNSNILYGSDFSTQVWVSRDRGYTWRAFGNALVGGGEIKSVAVNPLDTLQFLLGVEGGVADRIVKSTNGGATWTQTWTGTFSYFGKPVEFKPAHPDTVYTMGSDTLWRSTDFGSTWQVVRLIVGFTAWCDAEIRPDSANIIYVGDYATGIWKTTDAGTSWRQVYMTSGDGEIPSIAIDPFNPRVLYASRYSGGGGLLKSTDGGETWGCIPTPVKPNCATTNGGNTWWVTCSREVPGYVYFGTYGSTPGGVMISRDSGASWTNYNSGLTPSGLFNYGLLVLDTLTVIALQQDGIYKLQYPTGIRVLSPRGGEYFKSGSTQTISWVDSGLYAVNLELSTDGGSTWTMLADSLPASQTSYSWTVPDVESPSCRIRLTDALFTATAGMSDTTFTIYRVPLALTSPNGGEQWDVGSTHSVGWTAIPLVSSVDLLLSTDGGTNWSLITTLPSSPPAFTWTVPDSPSGQCRIRIVDEGDSTIADTSDSAFAIVASPTFRARMVISDNGGVTDSLEFGTVPGATDGIDSSLGETLLPPPPARGTFDVRWLLAGGGETKLDLRDTLGGLSTEHVFVGHMQPGPGGYPFALSWKPDSLRTETFILRDTLTHGELLSADMRRTGSTVVTDSSISAFEIVECVPVTVPIGVPAPGWNMIALPVVVGDRRSASLFPAARSDVFAYAGGYVRADTLKQGSGYWLKTGLASVTGCPLTRDTVTVRQGWNMIGSLSFPVSVASIVPIPDSVVQSYVFGYNGSGYTIASTLDPGRGYWVKTKSSGLLVLDTSRQNARPAAAGDESTAGLNVLTVSDGRGSSQSLFFGADGGGRAPERSEMPPAPPGGGFDARFSSFRQMALFPKSLENEVEYKILVVSTKREIFFSWTVDNEENFTYILSERVGKTEVAEARLFDAGSCVIPYDDQSTFALIVRRGHESAEVPRRFSLEEAYPNPFNPAVHVGFALPRDTYVRLDVFNILGERVATLTDGLMAAGRYSESWRGTRDDGTAVSSGVYYLCLIARGPGKQSGSALPEFKGIRKVVLLR